MLRTSSSSIVVTSTASESALEEDHPRTQDEEEEVRTKPRGFFADQFEVKAQVSYKLLFHCSKMP